MDKDAEPTGQRARMLNALERSLRVSDEEHHDFAASAKLTDDQLTAAQQEAAAPAYDAVREAGKTVDLRPYLGPIVTKWQARAKAAPKTERAEITRALGEFLDDAGVPHRNIETFDKAKQFLDEDIRPYFQGGDKGNKQLGRTLVELKNDFVAAVDAIDKENPNGLGPLYVKARDAFSGPEAAKREIQLGRDMFKEDSEVGVQQFKDIETRGGKNRAKLGYYAEVAKRSATVPPNQDVTRLLRTPKQEEILANIIERTETKTGRLHTTRDPATGRMVVDESKEFRDRPQRFGAFLQEEGPTFTRTKEIAKGGSSTARNLADDAAYDTLHKVADIFRDPSLTSIGRRGFEYVLNKMFGLPAERAQAMTEMLLTADPIRRGQIIDALKTKMGVSRFERFQEIMGQVARGAVEQTQRSMLAAGGSQAQPPDEAIQFLRKNASDANVVRQFEEKYGQSAQKFIEAK
jgi:hypothetical protein